MAGGQSQLVAYGPQDAFITGDSKISFFQAVYKRHTNFAMENIQQTVNGTASSGNRISITLARNGDLIGQMYMKLYLKNASGVVDAKITMDGDAGAWLAERAVADIELSIGGSRIDKHYQRWWRMYAELYLDESKKANYGKMTSFSGPSTMAANQKLAVYLPFLFAFNRFPGLYLPLIALQAHEVRLDIDLSREYDTYFTQSPEVWGNYVYLDDAERARFVARPHQYLFEQVQHTGLDSMATQIRLSYNHPVKFVAWSINNGKTDASNLWNLTTTTSAKLTTNVDACSAGMSLSLLGAPVLDSATNVLFTEENYGPLSANCASFKLVLNGQDRFKEQDGKFFNQVQPYWHMPGNPMPGIYMYSFAIKGDEYQPTGACNFSRIDNAQTQYGTVAGVSSYVQDMYAVSWNMLRIQNGMGGVMFAN